MSFRLQQRIKADLISQLNALGIELRGKEDTLDEIIQRLYSINKNIPVYELQISRANSKTIKDLHQTALDMLNSEKSRLLESKNDLEKSIAEITIKQQEFKEEIKRLVG